jgi:hypothetical protein
MCFVHLACGSFGTAAYNTTGVLFPNGSEVIISTSSPGAYVQRGARLSLRTRVRL